ncbi:hypothetical protein [Paenibacillus senegalimassiliensis]|uniref:hypothetical protein n=1 Tax=Paenibacillus senegalimassiliensis TaxID=1737426 RepID=UPI00073F2D58|nr:hypothetical protein [Paenibacillus senegalimassiliensis]
MKWYQVIEICNLEPLKIGAGGNKAHWDEPCKDYIPGSTLRGGAIARMQRLGLFEDPKSILQQMECSNAYLFREGQLYLPSPQHLRMDKHEYRRQKIWTNQGYSDGMVSLTNLYATTVPDKMYGLSQMTPKNQLPQPYVAIKDGYLEGIQSSKNYRLHHSSLLNKNLRERANLFSYQALEPGHIFRSIITYTEQIKPQIESMWNGQDIWYFGGSKGSGYGRCQVRLIGQPQTDYAEVHHGLGITTPRSEANASEELNVLTLTCLSDVIVRGRYGEPLPYLPEEVLEECGNIQIKRLAEGQCHFVQTGLTEGYNATWKARYPKETTIRAGSVMRYYLENPLDEQSRERVIAVLEQRRYGLRTQEGYGWIAVNLPYPSQLRVQPIPAISLERRGQSISTKLDSASAPHIVESIRLISKGLGDNRKHWLRLLIKKMEDASTTDRFESLKIHNLKPYHCRVMIELLKQWLTDQSTSKKGVSLIAKKSDKQAYRQNNEFFSLAGVHFNGVITFLENEHIEPKYEGLSQFASDKVNSIHGRIYYMPTQPNSEKGIEEIVGQKRFIAELLCEALYIYQMSDASQGAIRSEF